MTPNAGHESSSWCIDALSFQLTGTGNLPALTASYPLGDSFGMKLGVWEMNEGTTDDIEEDEIFIVLAGTATVRIHLRGDFPGTELHLAPGIVCRLSQGMQTTWTVHRKLRKVYLAPRIPGSRNNVSPPAGAIVSPDSHPII
ncbi:cupin domain-containing protein [Arthrobacter sp. UYCu712]|uniref:cupin domain-containing protein n=1 Tax=Arthrobacter sp. UYCu712 TaxID=3156340 RepID=UPI003393AEE9